MRESYPVEMDVRGHIVIPKGFSAHTMFLLYPEGNELRLVPGERHPKRATRIYSNVEIAQALIDGAITPEGIAAAKEGIRELGLDPDGFRPNLQGPVHSADSDLVNG